ncbi:MAG: helix-turn-helix domain-containing protein [Bacteroides sp.]|nr:helix-turn-helix domain-containing protein [Bacteroides sp.]
MMRILLLGLFLCGIVFARANGNTENDSIYTLDYVTKIHMVYPDSALHVLDVIDQRRPRQSYLTDVQRSLIYSSLGERHLALKYAEQALQNDSLPRNFDYYQRAILCAIDAYKQLDRYDPCIELLTKAVTFARERGIKSLETQCLFNIGLCYYELRQPEQAYRYFNQAIQICEEMASANPAPKPFLSYYYGELVANLSRDGRYEEALEVCHKRSLLIEDMKQYKDFPEGYIDQQLAYLNIKQATLLAKVGRLTEAEAAFRRFNQTEASKEPDMMYNSTLYYLATDQYHKALEICSVCEPADTISDEYANWLSLQFFAYKGLHQYDRALDCEERRIMVKDSLNTREKQSEIAELTTLYHVQEQEWSLRQKDEELRASAQLRNFLLVTLVLLLIIFAVYIRHTLVVKQKNRVMADRLDSLLKSEKEIDDLRQADIANEQALVEMRRTGSCESLSDEQLFRFIDGYIRRDKPYLTPDYSKQDMADHFSVSGNRLTQVLQDYAQADFAPYLAGFRLKHALNLLKIHPNYTLEAIAEKSGFGTIRQFQRLFKSTYGMTLSEYRKIKQQMA